MNAKTRDFRTRAPSGRTITPTRLLVMSGLVGLTLASTSPGAALSDLTFRPIEDFTSTQGTFCLDDGGGGCFLFVPPVPNYLGWAVFGDCIAASNDYAGIANEAIETLSGGAVSLGTTVDGAIHERPLADGRAEVTVHLSASNALSWAVGDSDPGAGCGLDFTTPPIFGANPLQVAAGAEPALAEVKMTLKFINPAPGAPMPDLMQLLFAPDADHQLLSIRYSSRATGTLPNGTPAQMIISQSALLGTGNGVAGGDAFPAEIIQIIPIGNQ